MTQKVILKVIGHLLGTRRIIRFPWVGLISGIVGTCLGTLWSQPSIIQTTDQAQWKTCFTPGQSCLPMIIKEIDRAEKSIHVQAYTLTSQSIANALIRAHSRGIQVLVLLDKSQKNDRHSQFNRLLSAGVMIRIDARPAIAHNKVMIIDHKITLTGSYNWTQSAEHRNAENLLIIDHPLLTKTYQKNFERRWEVSRKLR